MVDEDSGTRYRRVPSFTPSPQYLDCRVVDETSGLACEYVDQAVYPAQTGTQEPVVSSGAGQFVGGQTQQFQRVQGSGRSQSQEVGRRLDGTFGAGQTDVEVS